MFVIVATPVFADSIAALQQKTDAALADCMSHLPARQSMAWQDSKGRGKFPTACNDAKRSRDDARDMAKYRDDLLKMYDAAPVKPATRAIAQQESEDIASRMISTTNAIDQKFNMVNSSILNNLLVNIGAKDGGQCYQWVRELLKALPSQPYAVFERTWGGSHVHKFLENNSVIFTVRGQDVQTGILYDAWRDHGHPWWRFVKNDHYPWSVRFTEAEVIEGTALVIGNAEVKNAPKSHNP
jgi:hypothetical protein